MNKTAALGANVAVFHLKAFVRIAFEPHMQISWPSLPRTQAQLCTPRLLWSNNEVPQTHKPAT